MSQYAVILPTTGTVSGLQMTQAMNNALDTLNTLSSGAGAPASPEAGQLWHDTSANMLKLRSADNTNWITLLQLNEMAYAAMAMPQAGSIGAVNRIINGAFTVDQMNEGGSYAIPTNNTYTYTADQWVVACLSSSASAVTAQRVADAPPGQSYSLKITVGTGASSVGANDYLACWQPIEAQNINDFCLGTSNAGVLSLSFWVKSSQAGNYAVTLQNAAGSRACVNRFTINAAGVWQYITFSNIPCDQLGTWASGSSAALYLYFVMASGNTYQTTTLGAWQGGAYMASSTHTNNILSSSGATFQVSGVMLNAGVFNLPYERRSLHHELQACQRYFFKTHPQGTAVASAIGIYGSLNTIQGYNQNANYQGSVDLTFPVVMRAIPSITTYNPITSSNAQFRNIVRANDTSSIALNVSSSRNCSFTFTTSSGSNPGDANCVHLTANARM